MSNELAEILRENIEIAGRIQHHLDRSHQQIIDDIPLQSGKVAQLTDDQIDQLDLYLGRFSKLQDFITSKLFRSIALASLDDTSQDVSLIDTLRRMEKYGIVKSLDDWLEIRLLRNSLTHEYLTSEAAIAENINAAFSAYDTLFSTLTRAQKNNPYCYGDVTCYQAA